MIVSKKAYESAIKRGKRSTRSINGKKRSGHLIGTNFYFKAGPTLQKVSVAGQKNPCGTAKKRTAKKNPVRRRKTAAKTAARKTTRKTARKKAVKRYKPGAVYLMKRNPRGYNVYLTNASGTARTKKGYVLSKADARRWLKANGHTQAIIV